MRFLSADSIFPISSEPVKNGILIIEDDGKIVDLINPAFSNRIPSEKLELFEGVLCPGFINAHCHLELSHLKNKFIPGHGLPNFLNQVKDQRSAPAGEILEAMQDADAEMVANGIVAVGDISNTMESFQVKQSSRIHYHTFIELFDLHPDQADMVFDKGKSILFELQRMKLNGSLVPHAPYSVSKKLFDKIVNEDTLNCMHNQETESENEMFLSGSGDLLLFLQNASILLKNWKPTGLRSLPSIISDLPASVKIQFIHNTFSMKEDIEFAEQRSKLIWWCFCPRANRFIENRLPDIPMFNQHDCKITIGTDSYASNWSLSILEELKTIQEQFKHISINDLFTWATKTGAEFLGIEKQYGTFEIGKKPGVNLVKNVDLAEVKLMEKAVVMPVV